MSYDTLIIGAGLAGLHSALRLKQQKPKAKIAIAELYNYLGGRVVSYSPPDFPGVHWENGAGRIHSSHKMVLDYVKRYELHLIPLKKETEWRPIGGESQANTWGSLSTILVQMLSEAHPSILASHTIAELVRAVYGPSLAKKLLEQFAYWSELYTMRADLALDSLKHEMSETGQFFVVQEGLSALIKAMKSELEGLGVEFLLSHKCLGVKKGSADFIVDKKDKTIQADKIILAVHSEALKKIHPFEKNPILKHLKMEALLRIYAIFPLFHAKPWFSDIPHTVTDSPLKSIIPINPKQGTIMISYTDGADTKEYSKLLKTPKLLENRIMSQVRKLFPELEIPDPLFFKTHPWKEGCTYWIPSPKSPKEESEHATIPKILIFESEKIMNPYKGIYVCGESYSLRQAWMEGALEHAEKMLNKYY